MDARQAKKGGATEKPAGDWLFSVNVPKNFVVQTAFL
jgi:hypothetical protein